MINLLGFYRADFGAIAIARQGSSVLDLRAAVGRVAPASSLNHSVNGADPELLSSSRVHTPTFALTISHSLKPLVLRQSRSCNTCRPPNQ